jgi:hypothetical protein
VVAQSINVRFHLAEKASVSSLREILLYTLRMGCGTVLVMNRSLEADFLRALNSVAGTRNVQVVPVDDCDPKVVHENLIELAAKGDIVVLMAQRSFPGSLAHFAYVFNKQDGVVFPNGLCRDDVAAEGFALICWLTPSAWKALTPDYRDDLVRVTIGGGHFFSTSLLSRDPLSVLEEQRYIARRNPLEALRKADTFHERQALVREIFSPDKNGFERYDKEILEMLDKVTSLQDEELQQDFLDILVAANDLYLAKEALARAWRPRSSTMTRLAEAVEGMPHLGRQTQYFWDLIREMAERGDARIKTFMVRLIKDANQGFESVLHVLSEMQPWQEAINAVANLAQSNRDPAVLDLCRQILRAAHNLGLLELARPGGVNQDAAGPEDSIRVYGLALDNRQHYLETAQAIASRAGKRDLSKELASLASFQAELQDRNVGSYPKSMRTFLQAVEVLLDSRSWSFAVEHNHLASVSHKSEQYRLMREVMVKLDHREGDVPA